MAISIPQFAALLDQQRVRYDIDETKGTATIHFNNHESFVIRLSRDGRTLQFTSSQLADLRSLSPAQRQQLQRKFASVNRRIRPGRYRCQTSLTAQATVHLGDQPLQAKSLVKHFGLVLGLTQLFHAGMNPAAIPQYSRLAALRRYLSLTRQRFDIPLSQPKKNF
ncbi:hypothetical protein [Adhaeretor mobilis]|uniref:Uncharacterized protein n=1 Tax=Adhaeretor mobilis TaxID=1930276 RepID=A0A517MQQ4_9BACT|nr:hypothetical protein [Adhaeretor mobilis]QDS97216.1 hypothetical protein HG15A2_04760 [Adhaeretor mobilis]